jgi:ketosteroid isomerase-like protein
MLQKFPGERSKLVKQWLEEGKSVDEFVSFFTEDAIFCFGNAPPIIGRQGIRESSMLFRTKVKSFTHDIKSIYEQEDTVICEMDVTYTRHDGKVFTIPCMDIFRIEDNQCSELRIFMDVSPVFAS